MIMFIFKATTSSLSQTLTTPFIHGDYEIVHQIKHVKMAKYNYSPMLQLTFVLYEKCSLESNVEAFGGDSS